MSIAVYSNILILMNQKVDFILKYENPDCFIYKNILNMFPGFEICCINRSKSFKLLIPKVPVYFLDF